MLQPSPHGDPSAVPALAHAVTTTDLWKGAAIVLVLVDHYGLYFASEPAPWRLAGRLAAPVFFFLIGFAKTRQAPWTWIALGVGLTLVRVLAEPGTNDLFLNILLSFALLRLAVLPAVERWAMQRRWRVAALILACAALIPWTKPLLEYGTEGWLWAFFGLAHRLAGEGDDAKAAWARNTLGLVAGSAYLVSETANFAFDAAQAALLALLLAALVLNLFRFRRIVLSLQPPEPMAAALRFGGRRTLEIYAVTLFGMQILAYAIARGWV